jgi:hypothetical protein
MSCRELRAWRFAIIDNEAVIIVSPRRSLPPAPIARFHRKAYGVCENRRGGASNVYARTASTACGVGRAQLLVLGGIGLNAELTAKAIKLPGEVSFAFAPYGENLRQVNKARAAGRNHPAGADGTFGCPPQIPQDLLVNEKPKPISTCSCGTRTLRQ